jgi:branched-chain amino acid transport system permease protein
MKRQSVWVPLGIFLALAAVPVLRAIGVSFGGFLPLLLERVMVFGLAAMSLDFMLGIGGLVSFGHAAPLAIGAYAVAVLNEAGVTEAAIVVPCAMAAAGLFALCTGAVALRTRGVNFIMITLAFAQMVYFATASLADYGGDDGYTLYSRTLVVGRHWLDAKSFYVTALAILFAAWLLLRMLAASRFGRALAAVRQNRVRAQALGFNAFAIELVTMVIAAMLCAVAGVLLANEAEFVSPAYASWARSGDLMVMVILGGVGSLHGAIIGAFVVVMAEEGLGRLTQHWPLIYGPALILAVLFLRHGIAGIGGRRRG